MLHSTDGHTIGQDRILRGITRKDGGCDVGPGEGRWSSWRYWCSFGGLPPSRRSPSPATGLWKACATCETSGPRSRRQRRRRPPPRPPPPPPPPCPPPPPPPARP